MSALVDGIRGVLDRVRAIENRLPKRIYVGADVLAELEATAVHEVTDVYQGVARAFVARDGSVTYHDPPIVMAGCVWNGIPVTQSDALAPEQWWPDYDGVGMPRAGER